MAGSWVRRDWLGSNTSTRLVKLGGLIRNASCFMLFNTPRCKYQRIYAKTLIFLTLHKNCPPCTAGTLCFNIFKGNYACALVYNVTDFIEKRVIKVNKGCESKALYVSVFWF